MALAVGWVVYLRPASMGGPTGYVIVSGRSMEPMMHTGDLAIVHQQADYGVGDVVAYRIPKGNVGGGIIVIHRVVGGDVAEGLVLRGDNRDTADIWRPRRDDIVGTLRWHVPHLGTALFLLRTPLVIAGVVGFLGFWMVATWPDAKSRKDQPEAETPAETVAAPPVDAPPVAASPVEAARGAVAAAARDRSPDIAAAAVVSLSVAGYLLGRARLNRRAAATGRTARPGAARRTGPRGR